GVRAAIGAQGTRLGGAYDWYHDARTAGTFELAHRSRLYACRDGEHRCLLASGPQPSGGKVRAPTGQCTPRESGARTQDGRQGLRMAGATPGARAAARELRSDGSDP